ncbi:MAG TPA: hypothetical protein VL283_00135 [Candidatus Baltobacteraceae bacterium]|nr:hypothetical protein [Candidatus Baltobacteraceae bacterium]
MSHNTKISLWAVAALLAAAGAASAAGPQPLEVTAADLSAAGVDGVTAVQTSGERFAPPVKYFRSPEALSEGDAKKDCDDCNDLIAVYAAEAPTVPAWNSEKSLQFLKIGGRLQLRTYIASTKRIVTVTAVSETTLRKISDHLVAKFSK